MSILLLQKCVINRITKNRLLKLKLIFITAPTIEMQASSRIIESPSPDILASLPIELQYSVLVNLRQVGGIQCLFAARRVSRRWCRLIDDHLYYYFTRGPEVLYCYVDLWNRFRQKLIQQRVTLRLRV